MGDTWRVCEPVSPLLAPGLQVETVKSRQGKGLVPTSHKKRLMLELAKQFAV